MNARQKAKHYKKLYEQQKPTYKIIQFPQGLVHKHYAAEKVVRPEELCDFTEEMYFKCIVCPALLETFKEKMIENIEVVNLGEVISYRLDVWMKE